MVSENINGIVLIVGPIILGAAILWAIFNNRVSKRQNDRTEEATRKMYKEGTTDDSVDPRS